MWQNSETLGIKLPFTHAKTDHYFSSVSLRTEEFILLNYGLKHPLYPR